MIRLPLRIAPLRVTRLISRPLNELGFDPILRMPDFETFRSAVAKRKVRNKGRGS